MSHYSAKTVRTGGLSREELVSALEARGVRLNAYARQLLEDERFPFPRTVRELDTVELTVAELGFSEGAVLSRIFARAHERGFRFCPPELGPYLRLAWLDQPQTVTGTQTGGRAPAGSVTVASRPLSADDSFPKGFYLRIIDGEPWLRGYTADDLHVWSPEDRFLFCLPERRVCSGEIVPDSL